MPNLYDENYFEHGVKTGVSGYTDYHWKPEYVLPMANQLKKMFGKTTYLDYGCSKGFLVKALRMLSCEAYGYDISKYAIEHAEPEIQGVVSCTSYPISNPKVVIMKDVLEHMTQERIHTVIKDFYSIDVEHIVALIPLGDADLFRIREYELDKTHITKKDEMWWTTVFNQAGYELFEFYYSLPGFKDNWKQFPTGNGIFILRRLK